MSNLLNFALGGLTGVLTGSPFSSLVGSPLAALTGSLAGSASGSNPLGNALAPVSRDSQIADLADTSSSVNLLQQAAAGFSANGAATPSDEPQLSMPTLAPMPAPAKPADVPTDDHGQSNIVFADSDADGSLIH